MLNTQPVLAVLRVSAPDGVERTIAITQSPFCIGRAEHSDLILTEQQISRHHACLRFDGDQIQLVDVGSENGTWIDSSQLEANQPRLLAYHEVFRIGPYRLQLEPAAAAVPETSKWADPIGADAPPAGGPPPIGPLIEASPTGQLGVWLKTPQVSVAPGSSANLSLVIINQSPAADGYRVTLNGLPDHWLAAPLPLVELPAGAREEINVTIAPPRSPKTRAGHYRLLLHIASRSTPAETVEVRAELSVAPYAAFASTLQPPRIGANETAQVAVRNEGNASQIFTVTWHDAVSRYEFRPDEVQLTLSAGEAAATDFRAVPRRTRWFGGPRLDVYSVKVRPEDGPEQSHTGQIITTGLLPAWTIALLLVVMLCGVAGGVGALALMGNGAITPTPTTAITATPFITTAVTLTPTAGVSDSDGDGLTDQQEAQLGTDPRSADTDRDGLTDLDEVRRATSPTLSDSDGDGLLDGQEAFGCSDPRNPDTDGDGLRDNVDPDPCRLPTSTPAPTATPNPTYTPLPTHTPLPTLTPLPTVTPLPTGVPLTTITPLPLPTPVITDWRGEYYGNVDLSGVPLVVRNDAAIDFNWGRAAPDGSVPPDDFSVRWTRTLNFEQGAYRFAVRADDGVRVLVDEVPIINEWHPAAPQTYTVDLNLPAGPHTIRVEFYEGVFDAYILFTFEALP